MQGTIAPKEKEHEAKERDVLIAILAKDKAHCLPLYLDCIYRQDYPKEKIHLYIRTNNNRDQTAPMLKDWIERVGCEYASTHYDDSSVNTQIEAYSPHEWNALRFSVLAGLREQSLSYAQERGYHYFVVDCDNFIYPETLSTLLHTQEKVVGPLLRSSTSYSNYHHCTSLNGYFEQCSHYYPILHREITGVIEVDVIHCTYLIRYSALKWCSYTDGSERHEYVRFSDHLRQIGIKQYLDNRCVYGYLTFADDEANLHKEAWLAQF